jgi:murein DD-endopeptidase MepM/ murein hydrolase activator NlpD
MTVGKERLSSLKNLDQSIRNRRRHRQLILIASLFTLTALGGLALLEANPPKPEALLGNPEPMVAKSSTDELHQTQDRPTTASGKIETGESFYDLMKSFNMADAEILTMANVSRKKFSLRRIKSGQPYEIAFNQNGEPARFECEIDDHRLLIVDRQNDGWSAKIDPIEYEIRERMVEGLIQDSLYLSLVDACQSTVLAVDLADIFAWDIDFSLDLRKGDAYSILYQERWRGDRYVGPGRILAAQVINQGETYSAVYYEDGTGDGDYYDPDGRSLQKQFLKSPLRFKYISSYFSKSRLHPILKIRRPHLGVDYAAPYGTPVRASADGRVIYKGRNGGMGNMIKIRHNGIYATAYGHLSRYARKLKVGKSIKQGEIIGYVGSTGLSTGPHLHYAFYKNGKLINPMREQNPRVKSIPPSELPQFKALAERVLERVQPHESEKTAASVDRPGMDGRL